MKRKLKRCTSFKVLALKKEHGKDESCKSKYCLIKFEKLKIFQ